MAEIKDTDYVIWDINRSEFELGPFTQKIIIYPSLYYALNNLSSNQLPIAVTSLDNDWIEKIKNQYDEL